MFRTNLVVSVAIALALPTVALAWEQEQSQRQKSISTSVSTSVAVSGPSTSSAASSAAGGSGGSASARAGDNLGNVQTVHFEGDESSAASARAPSLTSGVQTCLGSIGGAVQSTMFGVSLGTTLKDNDCIRRLNADALYRMGYTQAALRLLAQNPDVQKALEESGVMKKAVHAVDDAVVAVVPVRSFDGR